VQIISTPQLELCASDRDRSERNWLTTNKPGSLAASLAGWQFRIPPYSFATGVQLASWVWTCSNPWNEFKPDRPPASFNLVRKRVIWVSCTVADADTLLVYLIFRQAALLVGGCLLVCAVMQKVSSQLCRCHANFCRRKKTPSLESHLNLPSQPASVEPRLEWKIFTLGTRSHGFFHSSRDSTGVTLVWGCQLRMQWLENISLYLWYPCFGWTSQGYMEVHCYYMGHYGCMLPFIPPSQWPENVAFFF